MLVFCPHWHPPAGQTISHIKQVPGWSERLASDSEAVVKAEHEVRRTGQRACAAHSNRYLQRCQVQQIAAEILVDSTHTTRTVSNCR